MYCTNHGTWMCGHMTCRSLYLSNGIDIDLGSGDVVVPIGGGFGIDVETGDLEVEIAPGLAVGLDDMF